MNPNNNQTFLDKAKDWVIRFGKKAWDYIKLARLELIVLAAALIVDLVSKAVVEATMNVGQTVVLIPKFLQFTFIYNPLAAFGSAFGLEDLIGQTAVRVIFIIITFVAVGVFGYFMYRNRGKNKVERIAFALIIAGALGNLVDRLFIGQVRDFIEIVFFGLDVPLLGKSFAIFNIADTALVAGVILFLVYILFLHKEKPEETEDAQVMPDDAPDANEGGQTADGRQQAGGENAAVPDTQPGDENVNDDAAQISGENTEAADAGGGSAEKTGGANEPAAPDAADRNKTEEKH